jgi:hypothetical protein
MEALAFRHRQNIIYRKDTIESRLSLLERWKNEGTIELDEYNSLLEDCTNEQVLIDNERKYGKNSQSFLVKESEKSKHTKDESRIRDTYTRDLIVGDKLVFSYSMDNSIGLDEASENAKIISEAFNVINECNLSPSQLLKQRDDLLESINEVIRFTDFTFLKGFHGAAMENLSKLKREIEKTKKITHE